MGGFVFDDFWVQRFMIADPIRAEAYKQSLIAAINPGDIVLDAGAGTGFLSLLAAQAGAGQVYAIERTKMSDLAIELIARNNFTDRIQVFRGDIAKVDLPSKVDVIVSDWMGGVGIDENMLQALLVTRDRWLNPGGRMLPSTVTAYLAPAWDQQLADQFELWHSGRFGVDLSLFAEYSWQEIFSERHHITIDTLIAAPQQLWHHDTITDTAETAGKPYEADLSFTVNQEGGFNGLATWFRAGFFGGITLSNAPDAPRNHWGRYVFPTNSAYAVTKGTKINVRFRIEPSSALFPVHYWDIQVGNVPWEKHASSQVTPFSDIRNTNTALAVAN